MSEEVRGDGVGPALGGEGSPCPEFTFWDKAWKVGWPTQKAKEFMELLVAKQAEDELEARRPIYAPDRFAAKERELERDLGAGHHRVHGPRWNAALTGPDSVAMLLCSLLQEHQRGTTLAQARTLWASGARGMKLALVQVVPSFVKVLVDAAPRTPEEKAAMTLELTALFLETLAPGPQPEPTTTTSPPAPTA